MGRSAAEQSAMPSEKAPIIVPGRQTDRQREERVRESYTEREERVIQRVIQRGRARGRKRKETMIGWIRERRMNKDELKEERRKKIEERRRYTLGHQR